MSQTSHQNIIHSKQQNTFSLFSNPLLNIWEIEEFDAVMYNVNTTNTEILSRGHKIFTVIQCVPKAKADPGIFG